MPQHLGRDAQTVTMTARERAEHLEKVLKSLGYTERPDGSWKPAKASAQDRHTGLNKDMVNKKTIKHLIVPVAATSTPQSLRKTYYSGYALGVRDGWNKCRAATLENLDFLCSAEFERHLDPLSREEFDMLRERSQS